MPRHELQNRDWAILTGNLGNQDDVHVRPFLRKREVVVRVDCRKRVLLLCRYDVFVLRSERQAVEVVCVILDAGIRAAW